MSLSGPFRDTQDVLARVPGRPQGFQDHRPEASPVGRTDSPSPGACLYGALAQDGAGSPRGTLSSVATCDLPGVPKAAFRDTRAVPRRPKERSSLTSEQAAGPPPVRNQSAERPYETGNRTLVSTVKLQVSALLETCGAGQDGARNHVGADAVARPRTAEPCLSASPALPVHLAAGRNLLSICSQRGAVHCAVGPLEPAHEFSWYLAGLLSICSQQVRLPPLMINGDQP